MTPCNGSCQAVSVSPGFQCALTNRSGRYASAIPGDIRGRAGDRISFNPMQIRTLALAVLAAVNLNAADTLRIWDRTWTVPAVSDWKLDEDVLHLVASRGPLPGP